jgi:hypothetical protein
MLYLCERSGLCRPISHHDRIEAKARSNLFRAHTIDCWSLSLLLSGIVSFGAFSWGVRGHFVADKTPGAAKIIFALSLLAMGISVRRLGDEGAGLAARRRLLPAPVGDCPVRMGDPRRQAKTAGSRLCRETTRSCF